MAVVTVMVDSDCHGHGLITVMVDSDCHGHALITVMVDSDCHGHGQSRNNPHNFMLASTLSRVVNIEVSSIADKLSPILFQCR